MLLRITTQALGPPVLARSMPIALAMLFFVSQYTAMVPGRWVLEQAALLTFGERAAVRVAITLFAALTGAGILRATSGSVLPWLRTLPVEPAPLAVSLLPSALLATLPVSCLALIVGPAGGVSVIVGSALLASAWVGRSWVLSLALVLLTAFGGWGLLVMPLLLADVGRAWRSAARVGSRRVVVAWPAAGPVGSLVWRDLLGLFRGPARWSPVSWGVATLGSVAVGLAVAKHWGPGQRTSAALILLGVLGSLPAAHLAACATAGGRSFLDRRLPVSPATRLAALVVLTSLPLGGPFVALLWVGTGTGGVGVLRMLATVGVLVAWPIRRTTRTHGSARDSLVGDGIAVPLALTLFTVAVGPLSALAVGFAAVALLFDTHRSLR